jgi:Cu/Ag efflux pump CusA
MKPIDTKTHGYIDYVMGILLVIAPYILNFNLSAIESKIFYVLGITAVLYSLLTRYELGLIKMIPMKVHLMLDALSVALLAASPWLFGFANTVYIPHLILGLVEIGAALMTNAKSKADYLN